MLAHVGARVGRPAAAARQLHRQFSRDMKVRTGCRHERPFPGIPRCSRRQRAERSESPPVYVLCLSCGFRQVMVGVKRVVDYAVKIKLGVNVFRMHTALSAH